MMKNGKFLKLFVIAVVFLFVFSVLPKTTFAKACWSNKEAKIYCCGWGQPCNAACVGCPDYNANPSGCPGKVDCSPGGCNPSCSGKECGSDGCSGSCGTCEGPYLQDTACSGGECMYQPAELTASANELCLGEDSFTYEFVLTGTNSYCGNVTTITAPWHNPGEEIVIQDNSYEPYTFTHTLTLPENHDTENVVITITSNRESIKNNRDGEYDYNEVCTIDVPLTINFDNFFYCPKPGENHANFDFYQDSTYYDFYGDGTEYDWDECASNEDIETCTPYVTDCVAKDGSAVSMDTAFDGDEDINEYEVCHSEDDIQGGWLDPDVNSETCEVVDSTIQRRAEWYDCQPQQECDEAIDSFDNDLTTGLCCGDEVGEFVTQTKTKLDGSYVENNGVDIEYSACCDESISCVDESSVCRPVGYDTCISSGGYRATCVDNNGRGEWVLAEDTNCEDLCNNCDVNDDGKVDQQDTTIITNNFCTEECDDTFDINDDAEIDQQDVAVCQPLVEDGAVCFGCRDGTLNQNEGCEDINGNVEYNCPQQTCDGKVTKTRLDTCTDLCSCEYEESCVLGQCDAECSDDGDCANREECSNNCECVDYIIGGEFSVHIYEDDCIYRLCVNSGPSDQENHVIGKINTSSDFLSYETEGFEGEDKIIQSEDKKSLYFESYVTSHQDCIEFETDGEVTYDFDAEEQCASEGEAGPNPSLGPSDSNPECCAGLDALEPTSIYDENCEYNGMTGWGYVCSDCGNGVCEEWESDCTCPEDCEEGYECAAQGEGTGIGPEVLDCCTGLEEIAPKSVFDSNCEYNEMTGWGYLCSDCGNGVCDAVEDECNCPDDCGENTEEDTLTLDKIYFEPYETHPSSMPFSYSTPMSNECRECIPTEDPETTLDDGIDNDCDGLVDEPKFGSEYASYIWEANCQYYLCANSLDSEPHTTQGLISVEDEYDLYEIKTRYWENSDEYVLSSDEKELEFTSYINNDKDCILFRSDTLMSFDLDMNGSHSIDNVYLTQDKINPLENPFAFAAPECTLSCTDPVDCGTDSVLYGTNNCGYENCIFDCGGYWVNTTSTLGDVFTPSTNPGDYCEACTEDIVCSDYNNKPSCVFNPCDAGESIFGCYWNETSRTCDDIFEPCRPGTTLCEDGTCSVDCEETDTDEQGCINDNGECDEGEGCACEDCEGEQDSCTEGAVCDDDGYCGCPAGTTLCKDGTCSEDCEETDDGNMGCIDENDICEFGEGCACEDCNGYQDSCVEDAVCNYVLEECVELEIGNCPEGTTLCNDLTCDEDCDDHGGKAGCIGEPNDECELGEGCACSDCNNKRDSCAPGLVCNYEYELCESLPGGGGTTSQSCEDNDNDGYYEIDEDCFGSDDCNDYNSAVHPGAIELCNNIDDDCDGDIDENCITEGEDSLELSINTVQGKARVLDKFTLVSTVKNKLNREVSDVLVTLDAPLKFAVQDRSVVLDTIPAGGEREVSFEVIVKDYSEESAELTLNAKLSDSNTISEDFNLAIEIPDFLIAPMPMFEYPNTKRVCLDFYYVINNPSLGNTDVEFEISDPGAVFGKSVVVDYVSSVNTNNILIRPMLSNPYCVSGGRTYDVNGYLYKPGAFIVDKVDESSEKLILR